MKRDVEQKTLRRARRVYLSPVQGLIVAAAREEPRLSIEELTAMLSAIKDRFNVQRILSEFAGP